MQDPQDDVSPQQHSADRDGNGEASSGASSVPPIDPALLRKRLQRSDRKEQKTDPPPIDTQPTEESLQKGETFTMFSEHPARSESAPMSPPSVSGQLTVETTADPPPSSKASADEKNRWFSGEKELHAIIDRGFDVYLMFGFTNAGKTQFIESIQHDSALGGEFSRLGKRKRAQVMPTALNTLKAHIIDHDNGQHDTIFLDVSGENYAELQKVEAEDLAAGFFNEKVIRHIRGMVVIFDLNVHWYPSEKKDTSESDQSEMLSIMLKFLRFVLFCSADTPIDRDSPINMNKQIDIALKKLRGSKRLPFPVLVLFSKADKLFGRIEPESGYAVKPIQDSPFFLAYHKLSPLHKTLEHHVNHFRYDYVHAFQEDDFGGVAMDNLRDRPCGVSGALAWLSHPRWRHGERIWPTATLVAWQRRLDWWLGRYRRWREWPL